MLTVAEVKRMLNEASTEAEFAALERSLVADTRKGVRQAVEVARRRIAAQAAEAARLRGMYAFQCELALKKLGEVGNAGNAVVGANSSVGEAGTAGNGGIAGQADVPAKMSATPEHNRACEGPVIVGLDEVGRGPVAGPLAVGAVVLPNEPLIAGLNDSKQVAPAQRSRIACDIKKHALAWTVQYIDPATIDACGMTASLVTAFRRAIAAIEAAGVTPQVVLLDGNPLRMDPREVNVVKGDGKCASIAAASIIAKVERDALMDEYAKKYPHYGFEHNKGYASANHISAIQRFGLSDIHRKSFCTAFTQTQERLF